jgi:hypothetical protein
MYHFAHYCILFYSSWNSEIAEVYPQYSLQNINQLESLFCHHIKWDLYISSSLYAKYYFALRSLSEKSDFRRYHLVKKKTYCVLSLYGGSILHRRVLFLLL